MNKAILLAALLVAVSQAFAKEDRKIIYLGDDRYTCRGTDCGAFMARERQAQAARERERQRDVRGYNDYREQRQRERESSFDPYDTSSSRWRD